jgi:hypothetical protein
MPMKKPRDLSAESGPIIGFDTEYTPDPTDPTRNIPLSIQWCVIGPDGRQSAGIWHTWDGTRLRFSEWIVLAIRDAMAKGVLKRWPSRVVACAHFSAAEFTMFADRAELGPKLSLLRATFATLRTPLKLSHNVGGHPRRFRVDLVDTILLTPAKKSSLKDLGALLGLEKLEVSKAYIENMGAFRQRDLAAFEAYAMRDAEIAARYYERVRNFAREQGLYEPGTELTTLGALSARGVLRALDKQGIDPATFIGERTQRTPDWVVDHEGRPRKISTSRRVAVYPEAATALLMAASAYVGGRNEAFVFGPHHEGPYLDYDLKGAYSSAMAAIRMPDWKATRQTINPNDFTPEALAVARIDFEFPTRVRFPVFACDAEARGLLFPRKGSTFAWAPEIAAALALGASVTVREGYVVPWMNDTRPLADFAKAQNMERAKAKTSGDVFGDMQFKEIVNSAYGKMGQGLKGKTAYRAATGESELIGPSDITNAFFAGYITAFVRAVLAEILNKLPPRRTVANAITDGFLTNATDQEVAQACSGPLATYFAECRLRATGETGPIYEAKGHAPGVCVARTRLHFSLDAGTAVFHDDPDDLDSDDIDPADRGDIAANVGIKFDEAEFAGLNAEESKRRRSQLLETMFANRTVGQKLSQKSLRKGRALLDNPLWDMTSFEREHKLRMEFDFKRRVAEIYSGEIGGANHLAFSTEPWNTLDEFKAFRDGIDGSDFVLKAAADLEELDRIRKMNGMSLHSGKRLRGEGVSARASRAARDVAASQDGLGNPRDIAGRLNRNGIATTATAVSQARKDSKRRGQKLPSFPYAVSAADVAHRLDNSYDGLGPFILSSEARPEFEAARIYVENRAGELGEQEGEPVAAEIVAVSVVDGPGVVGLKGVYHKGGRVFVEEKLR